MDHFQMTIQLNILHTEAVGEEGRKKAVVKHLFSY